MSDASNHKEARPDNRRDTDRDGLKMHLRVLDCGGRTLRVLSLRPGTDAAFSVNHFHGTWHLVTDRGGARLLARLLWGLSYQREAGTLVALFGEHIHPTPFDADPSPPVVLVPAHLTPLDAGALRALKERLRRPGNPDRTVRLHTWGLDVAEAGDGDFRPHEGHHRWVDDFHGRYDTSGLRFSYQGDEARIWARERMAECGGFICYAAPPLILRKQAASVAGLKPRGEYSDYHYLAEEHSRNARWGGAEGEVQVFPDYGRMLSEAAVARREVLASPDGAALAADPQGLRVAVWGRKLAVEGRRRRDTRA